MPNITRDWAAQWVWLEGALDINTHVLFRSELKLGEKPAGAKLFIAAESFARVYINGREVSQTSSLSYPTQHYYEVCELDEYLTEGVNDIAVLAWYIGVPSGASVPKQPGLRMEIAAGESGEVLWATGKDSVKCRRETAWLGQRRRSHWLNLDLIETVDHRLLDAEFPFVNDLADFADASPVEGAGVLYGQLQQRTFPKPDGDDLEGIKIIHAGEIADLGGDYEIAHMAVGAEHNAVLELPAGGELGSDFSVSATADGKAYAMVLGLGDYEKGLPLFTAGSCEGARVDITWLEHLNRLPEGETVAKVYTTDTHILAGREVNIHPDEWKCGRYLKLTFRNIKSDLDIKNFRWRRQHYPLGRKLKFSSSSEKLNEIVRICLGGAAACMHDNIMDCPWRERRQWIGDVQRIGLVNHYAFGDMALVRATLAQHIHMQDVNGRMYSCLPIWEEYPTQSMEWFHAVLEYCHYTGDESLLDDVGDNVEMLHRWFLKNVNRDSHGLLRITAQPVLNWMDNPYGGVVKRNSVVRNNQHHSSFATMNLRYLLFLDDIMAAARKLGRPWMSVQAANAQKCIAEAVVKTFFDPETYLLKDCSEADIPTQYSEMAHAMAVLSDLPGIDNERLWDSFGSFAAANKGGYVEAGPFGIFATLEALAKLGRTEKMLEIILAKWGVMVDRGADTTYEHFDGNGSHCHGWAGTPVVSMARHIFGLDPITGGSRRVENFGGIDWMECSIEN